MQQSDLTALHSKMRPFYLGVPSRDWLKISVVENGSIKLSLTTLATSAGILFTISQLIGQLATLDLVREMKRAGIEKVKAETLKIHEEIKSLRLSESSGQRVAEPIPELAPENSPTAFSASTYQILEIDDEDRSKLIGIKSAINYEELIYSLGLSQDFADSERIDPAEAATNPITNVLFKFSQLGYEVSLESYEPPIESTDTSSSP